MLTDTLIRRGKLPTTPKKLSDGKGLYLLLRPDGGKWWRWDYRRPITNKRNTLSLGTYPDVSLAAAREKHAEARKLLAAGIDPGEQRKASKAAGVEKVTNSFQKLAEELLAMRAKKLAEGTAARELRLLDKGLAPYIGRLPVADVSGPCIAGGIAQDRGARRD